MALLSGWSQRLRAACGLAALFVVPHVGFAGAAAAPEIAVRTSAELVDALRPSNTGRRIRLYAGTYAASAPLLVPDGAVIEGGGVMQYDADGLPAGFERGTETVIAATAPFAGDLLTLGDRAQVRRLSLRGQGSSKGSEPRDSGNVLAIVSRQPGDVVRATVSECEIVNSSSFGVDTRGPTGRAVVVMTLNPGGGATWHAGARVSARIERSIVLNERVSNSIFAINFAGRGAVALELEHNRLEGRLTLAGGAGRPNAVEAATATLVSRRNLYVSSGGPDATGWQIIGGSGSAHAQLEGHGARSSSSRVESDGDRIEGYQVGILAAAGRSIAGLPGPVVGNHVELLFRGLRVRTTGTGAADLSLHGFLIEAGPDSPSLAGFPGENNVLRVTLEGSSGSGPRENVYAHAPQAGPVADKDSTRGNRLEIVGNPADFLRSNSTLEPAPDAAFFVPAPAH